MQAASPGSTVPRSSRKSAYWFPVKRYGWGWGLPVCWQGWVVFVGYLVALLGGLRYFVVHGTAVHSGLVYCIVLTLVFVAIVVIKGERPSGWRWGRDRKQ